MKMGHNNFSADDVVNKLSSQDLEQIFKFFGEEEQSKKIAKIITNHRIAKNVNTEDLVKIINYSKKNFTKKNKATKVFQALRMLVNNEISELIIGLSKSSNLISKNGIIVTVTFHSIEDRICKFFFNKISSSEKVSRYMPLNKTKNISFSMINKKPIIPSLKEIENNPPSRSAKLRGVKRNDIKKIDTNFLLEKFKNLLKIEKLSLKL